MYVHVTSVVVKIILRRNVHTRTCQKRVIPDVDDSEVSSETDSHTSDSSASEKTHLHGVNEIIDIELTNGNELIYILLEVNDSVGVTLIDSGSSISLKHPAFSKNVRLAEQKVVIK